jgi:hypothetical protein
MAPPLRSVARGKRISSQYVVDLENCNEWPNASDYLLVCDGLIEEEENSIYSNNVDNNDKKGKRAPTVSLSKVRGELGVVKRAKTEEPPQNSTSVIQAKKRETQK